MLRQLFFPVLLMAGILPRFAAAEELTITTYYPSPNGVYKTLRLFPSAISMPPCNEGELTYNNVSGQQRGLYFCNSANQWQQFTYGSAGGGGGALGLFGGLYTRIIPGRVTGVASCVEDPAVCSAPNALSGSCGCPAGYTGVVFRDECTASIPYGLGTCCTSRSQHVYCYQ